MKVGEIQVTDDELGRRQACNDALAARTTNDSGGGDVRCLEKKKNKETLRDEGKNRRGRHRRVANSS